MLDTRQDVIQKVEFGQFFVLLGGPGQNLGDPRNETRRTQHSNMLIRPNDILRKTWMMKKKKSENYTTLVVLNAMCANGVLAAALVHLQQDLLQVTDGDLDVKMNHEPYQLFCGSEIFLCCSSLIADLVISIFCYV